MIAADAEHRKQITKSSLRTWRQKKSFAQGAKRGQWVALWAASLPWLSAYASDAAPSAWHQKNTLLCFQIGESACPKRVQRSCRAFALAPRWGAWTLRVQALQIAAGTIISV